MRMIENLWNMGLYGCLPILLILAARRMMRGYPKEYSCYLWILALARLLLPVWIEKPFGACPLRYMGELRGSGRTAIPAFLYLAGVCAVSGYFLVSFLRFRRRLRTAVREPEKIWRCEHISSAFVMGLVKPKIFLPYGLEGIERRYVVLHERMHIRHGDPWMRAFGTAALCLHWWNPLVWYAVSRMYEDMEMCCDEAVLKECASPERKIYADVLLKLSEEQSGLWGLCFGRSNTGQRIRNLLGEKKKVTVRFVLLFYLALQLCVRICFTVPR